MIHEKAVELQERFGNKANDVVDEILSDISSYRSKPYMSYEQTLDYGQYWRDVKKELFNLGQPIEPAKTTPEPTDLAEDNTEYMGRFPEYQPADIDDDNPFRITKGKTASACLSEYGIEIMRFDDHFNGQLLAAMEAYRNVKPEPVNRKITELADVECQENCCTPTGQVKRYVNCVGCDMKPAPVLGGIFSQMKDMEPELLELLNKYCKSKLSRTPTSLEGVNEGVNEGGKNEQSLDDLKLNNND